MDYTLKQYFKDLKLINEIEQVKDNQLHLNTMYLNELKQNLYENINLTMAFVLASIEMQHIQDKERTDRQRKYEEERKKYIAIHSIEHDEIFSNDEVENRIVNDLFDFVKTNKHPENNNNEGGK